MNRQVGQIPGAAFPASPQLDIMDGLKISALDVQSTAIAKDADGLHGNPRDYPSACSSRVS